LSPAEPDENARTWTVAQKARVLTDAAGLKGVPLYVYLKRLGVSRVEYERWRRALQEDPQPSAARIQRLYKLRRAVARQQRAMARAAALLVDPPNDAATESRGRRHRRAQRPSPPGSPRSDEVPHRPVSAKNTGAVRYRPRGVTAAGRSRKFHRAIPAHIDQSKLPKGIYWNNTGKGRWFVFVTDPDTGARNTKVVAGKNARLSVLHAIVAQPRDYIRGTLGWVMARFEESSASRNVDTFSRG
jgi:hypothetical protein